MEPACPSALEICSDCNDVKKRIYFFHQLNARESPWYQMVSMEPKPNFQNKNIDSSPLLSLCVKTFFFRQISQSFLIWSLLLHAVGKTKLPWRAPMFLLLSMSHSYWSSGTFSPSSWAQLWLFLVINRLFFTLVQGELPFFSCPWQWPVYFFDSLVKFLERKDKNNSQQIHHKRKFFYTGV